MFKCGECNNKEDPCEYEGEDLSGSTICPWRKDYIAEWYTLLGENGKMDKTAELIFDFMNRLIENEDFGGKYMSTLEIFSNFLKLNPELLKTKACINFIHKHADLLLKDKK